MRIAIRIAALALGLLLLLALGLLLALPRLARSDAVRARIEAAGREATGREVQIGGIDFGLLPPRLVVRQPRVVGEEGGPAFEADEIALEVALAPLLRRTVVVDSLVLQGARTRLVRTRDGLLHPFRAPEEPEEPPVEPSEPREDEPFALELHRLVLRDGAVTLEDRTLSPPVVWELEDLDARLRGEGSAAPIDVELSGRLASGGRVRVEGTLVANGPFDLAVALDALRVDPAAVYLQSGQHAAGAASGQVTVRRGSGDDDTRVHLDLVVDEGELAADVLRLRGRMGVVADLERRAGPTAGTFRVDATDAEVDYGSAFTKPRGQSAVATGRIVQGEGGILLEDTKINVKNFEGEVRLETGARTRATISAPPFELEGWEALVPALAGLAPRGRLGLEGFQVATAPLALGGRLVLEDLRVRRPEGDELALDGALAGEGDMLRGRDLSLRFADQSLRLDLALAGLDGRPRFEVGFRGEGIDVARVLARDVLQGEASLDGRLRGPLGGERPLLETVAGQLQLHIAPGRIGGVSLLQRVFEPLGRLAQTLLLVDSLRSQPKLARYYQEEFRSLDATLQIADGVARTRDLRLLYDHYRADLAGAVGLQDRSLDLQGELVLDPVLVADVGAAGSADAPARESRTIPIQHIGGTLDSPRPELDRAAAVAYARLYANDRRQEKWERKLDERLGEGAGKQVLDALEGILGGTPR